MRTRSKRYTQEREQISGEPVGLKEGIEKLKGFKSVKFNQSVECILHLGIDPRQADQIVRGSVSLPHGIGTQKRVVAFCEGAEVQACRQAGAVEAGSDELIEKINNGWLDFDVAVASSNVMRKVGKLGRILGPQGKMPTPKNGTVTEEVVTAVKEFTAGKVEYRNDSGGILHSVVGKQSFETQKLIENINAFVSHIKKQKPASSKGAYIRKSFLKLTMSPSIRIAV